MEIDKDTLVSIDVVLSVVGYLYTNSVKNQQQRDIARLEREVNKLKGEYDDRL